MVECIFVFNLLNSGRFHLIEKNKISEAKLGSRLSKTRSIPEVEQKALVQLLIKCRTFSLGHLVQ